MNMPETSDAIQSSIEEIAKFVKNRTDAMSSRLEEVKKELQALFDQKSEELKKATPPDSGRISELESRLKSGLEKTAELDERSRLSEKKTAEIEEKLRPHERKFAEIEEKLAREVEKLEEKTEQNLSSMVEQGIKMYLDRASDVRAEMKSELGSARRDFVTQTKFLEGAIRDLKADLRSLDISDIETKLYGAENRLADMQNLKPRLGELEKQIMQIKSMISTRALKTGAEDVVMVEAHIKRLDDLEAKLVEVSKAMSKGTYSVMLSKLKEEIMNYVDSMRSDTNEKLRYIEDMLGESRGAAGGGHDPEAASKIEALTNEFNALQEHAGQIDRQFRNVNEEYSKISGQIKHISENYPHLENQLKQLSEQYAGVGKQFKEEVHEQYASLASQLKQLSEHYAQLDGQIKQIGKLESIDINKIEHMDKELSALKSTTDHMNRQLGDVMEQYAKISKGPESYEELIDDVLELKRSVGEESALRISTDKALQDLENETKRVVNEFSSAFATIKGIEKTDYAKAMEALQSYRVSAQQIEEGAKMEAMKVATKQIDEFAKAMDKKMPNIATKDELVRMEEALKQIELRLDQKVMQKVEQKIDQRMQALKPQTIGVTPLLDKRIEALEKSVRDLIYIMKSSAARPQPFVIE